MATYRSKHARQVNEATEAWHIVDHPWVELHDGNVFTSGYRFTNLADDASVVFHFKTGSKIAYSTGAMTVGGDSHMDLSAYVTASDNGTAIYGAKKNSTSTTEPTMVVYHTPTFSDAGTIIFSDFIPGGQKSKASGGTGSLDSWILAPNTSYAVTITNKSGAAIDGSFVNDWVEHTDHDEEYFAIPYSNRP